MVEACESADVDLVVNYTLRFTEKFQHLREHIRSGETLGDVRSVAVQSRMELARNATHVLDLLTYLFDDDIDTVWGHLTGENESVKALSADIEVDDAAGRAMVSLDNIHATVDCTVPREPSAIGYRFLGTAGKLDVTLDNEWRYWRLKDGNHISAEMAGIDDPWTWDEDYENGFRNAIRHVCRRLDGVDRTVCTGRDAIASLEALVGIFVSHYTGSRVSLPLERLFEEIEIRSW